MRRHPRGMLEPYKNLLPAAPAVSVRKIHYETLLAPRVPVNEH